MKRSLLIALLISGHFAAAAPWSNKVDTKLGNGANENGAHESSFHERRAFYWVMRELMTVYPAIEQRRLAAQLPLTAKRRIFSFLPKPAPLANINRELSAALVPRSLITSLNRVRSTAEPPRILNPIHLNLSPQTSTPKSTTRPSSLSSSPITPTVSSMLPFQHSTTTSHIKQLPASPVHLNSFRLPSRPRYNPWFNATNPQNLEPGTPPRTNPPLLPLPSDLPK